MLEAQAERLAADGRFGLALDVAMRAVRADPLRESAHRAVISIHLAEGNVAQAHRALRRCADVLRSELGIAPSPQTARLVSGVLHGDAMVTVG
jgi:DNA-binding SARP family transcriptional activator